MAKKDDMKGLGVTFKIGKGQSLMKDGDGPLYVGPRKKSSPPAKSAAPKIEPAAAKPARQSTGPVSRGVKRQSTGPVSRGEQKTSDKYGGSVGAFGRGAANTLTFGAADHIAAAGDYAVKKLIGRDTTYARELAQEKEKTRGGVKFNPNSTTAGNVAGFAIGAKGIDKAGRAIVGGIKKAAEKTIPKLKTPPDPTKAFPGTGKVIRNGRRADIGSMSGMGAGSRYVRRKDGGPINGVASKGRTKGRYI